MWGWSYVCTSCRSSYGSTIDACCPSSLSSVMHVGTRSFFQGLIGQLRGANVDLEYHCRTRSSTSKSLKVYGLLAFDLISFSYKISFRPDVCSSRSSSYQPAGLRAPRRVQSLDSWRLELGRVSVLNSSFFRAMTVVLFPDTQQYSLSSVSEGVSCLTWTCPD